MKRIISIIMSISLLLGVFLCVDFSSSAATMATTFTPRINAPDKQSTWIVKYNTSNNCTRYCYGRISEILNKDANDILGARPDANVFPTRLSNAGYSYGSVPKPGSVMCTSGHVAVVESVDYSNGTLVVSEGHSYTNMSNNSKSSSVIIDGIQVIGKSTITSTSQTGTWFDLRTINYNDVSAKYYYLVPDEYLNGPTLQSFEITSLTADSIGYKYTINNQNKYKISKRRIYFRKTGDSKWKYLYKNYSPERTNNINVKGTLDTNRGIIDNTEYEIYIYYIANSYVYRSPVYKVKTPARIDINNLTIKQYKYKYTGNAISTYNFVRIYNSAGEKLVGGVDYKASVSTVTSIGRHTIVYEGINGYKGKITKSILIYPKTPTLKSLSYKSSTNRIYLKWARVANCTKQQIMISTSSNFSTNYYIISTGANKQSCSLKKLSNNGVYVKKGKRYYIKMRAYKTVNGNNIYGNWGTAKSIVCK